MFVDALVKELKKVNLLGASNLNDEREKAKVANENRFPLSAGGKPQTNKVVFTPGMPVVSTSL